jgi:Cu/Ag efflux protein CusF
MSIQVKLRRGTTSQHSTFTGSEGEVTVDTDKDVVVVHDGTTAGGHPLAKASSLATVATSGDYNDLINLPSAGTVTSVALSAPTGLSVSGSPVTTSGTLALSFASGYSIPTTTKQSEWDTAYSWGNHASVGYLDSGDIGTTVQGYSSVLAGTTASFTTADETKLDGIAAGAEVNVNADWNAVSGDAQILNKPSFATVATTGAYSDLTGKPTLGTAAATASTDYATAAQGTKADSAVQPAAIANMLETSDIGATVQGYSAVLAGTTASFTTADETKLDGIAAGAEVNVNADWNSSSGDSQILNKPAILAFSGGITEIAKVSALPGSPNATTLYIVV